MGITAAGPAGYSYQDDATVWLVLAWRHAQPLQVIADAGQEDATFTLTLDGGQRTIEAQMKSGAGFVNELLFTQWLAHFHSHKDTGSLLEQLRDRSDLSALFVFAAHGTNAVAPLCVSEPDDALRPRAEAPLTRAQARKLLDAFAQAYAKAKPGTLDARRHDHCAAVATRTTEDSLREISRRIFVLPHFPQASIRERASALLNKAFFVPQSQTRGAIDALAKIVRDASGASSDIAAPIIDEASRHGRQLLLRPTEPHVVRPEEDELFAELRDHNVLLLTGLPNAGKTRTARALASRSQREGYHAEEGSDVAQARRFLLEPGPEEKIFLLDDPLGQMSPAPNAHQALNSLRGLISDVDRHRKLIVTTRFDVLRAISGEQSWEIDGHSFHDLSLTDQTLAASIWAKHTNRGGIEPEALARVETLLRRQAPGELLQPGQIRYLARNLKPDTGEDEWLRIARYDGQAIGRELCADAAMRDVLAALRMLASTAVAVSAQELFFVLTDTDALPGKDLSDGRTVGSGGRDKARAPVFPSYSHRHEGNPSLVNALDALEKRGLVERTDAGYRFSHPSYLVSAEQPLRSPGSGYFPHLLALCKRALFCLRPRNATLAVEALALLRDSARTKEARSSVLDLTLEAFSTSLFPAVRDRCLFLLLRWRDQLDARQYERVLRSLRLNREVENRVVWHEGEAWFDPRDSILIDDPFTATEFIPYLAGVPAAAQLAWQAARRADRFLPEFLWSFLYRQRPENVDLDIVQRAFSYDEAFLRAQAARIAMECHPGRDDLAQRIFTDEHPVVFGAGLEGLLCKWGGPDEQVRLNRLRQILTRELTPDRSTVVLPMLEKFEDVGGWHEATELPGEPWALLAASALRAASPMARVDAGHLSYHAESVLPRVERALALSVVQAWLDWAERAVRVHQHSDETVNVVHLWFLVTGADVSQRPGVIARLLGQEDTTFFVHSVSGIVKCWHLLDEQERWLVLEVLDGARPDARWARAVALTRSRPPPAIVARLLGAEDALRSMFRRRLEPVDRRLLGDCLRVYDDVGGAADLGVSRALWRLIILLSAEPKHPLFERALDYCVMERKRSMDLWTRNVWLKLCCKADDRLREQLFQCLLDATIMVNSGHFQQLWLPLLDTTTSDAVLERWAERLEPCLEAIENNDNVKIFFCHSRIAPMLLRKLQRDMAWFEYWRPEHPAEWTRRLVEALYDGGAPRLRLVHDEILRTLGADAPHSERENVPPDPLAERVRAARSESISAGSHRDESVSEARRRPIEDWVWLYERSRTDGVG